MEHGDVFYVGVAVECENEKIVQFAFVLIDENGLINCYSGGTFDSDSDALWKEIDVVNSAVEDLFEIFLGRCADIASRFSAPLFLAFEDRFSALLKIAERCIYYKSEVCFPEIGSINEDYVFNHNITIEFENRETCKERAYHIALDALKIDLAEKGIAQRVFGITNINTELGEMQMLCTCNGVNPREAHCCRCGFFDCPVQNYEHYSEAGCPSCH